MFCRISLTKYFDELTFSSHSSIFLTVQILCYTILCTYTHIVYVYMYGIYVHINDVVAATKDSALCCKAWLLLMKVQPDMIPSFDVSGIFTISCMHSYWCALAGVFYFAVSTCTTSRTTVS